jgi:hypothetical protein
MQIHKTVLWSLQAEDVRKDLRRFTGVSAREFRWHWTAGGAAAYAVAHVRHDVTNMLEQIELWLRVRIRTQLSLEHKDAWWTAIPVDVRHRADRRYRVACDEFGKKRAGAAHSTDWLSFGDLLKLLAGLRTDSWRNCLESTVKRTPQAHQALAGIKSFRNARVAHLQSGGPTPTEIKRLLCLADRLCEVLRPQDYILSHTFRRALSGITREQKELLMNAYSPYTKPRPGLVVRLRTLDRILPATQKGPARVQPEYFAPKDLTAEGALANIPVEAVGVLDGLGKKHRISADNLSRVVNKCAGLPVRTAVYKHKQTGNLVVAFHVKDASTMVSKN